MMLKSSKKLQLLWNKNLQIFNKLVVAVSQEVDFLAECKLNHDQFNKKHIYSNKYLYI